MKASVSIVKVNSKDEKNIEINVIDAVKHAMELSNWKNHITPGKDVALKLNLTLDILLPGADTSPWVTKGVIETIHDYVGDIYIVDSDQLLFSADKAYKISGVENIARDYKKVIWHNLTKNKYRPMDVMGSNYIKTLNVPEIFFFTEAITVPVMKTHFRSMISCSLKNQYGCIDFMRHNYHHFLSEIIYLINYFIKIKFSILDATVSMEGDGPKSGFPKVTDLVLASSDMVALDAVSSKIMGFNPSEVEHIRYAANKCLGIDDLNSIDIKGEDYSHMSLGFKPARKNFVAVVEAKLRDSAISKTIFGTKMLDIMSIGAKIWYYLWFIYKGRSLRNPILKNSPYKGQWS
jgi:uncharacterized protein (DUF362 family)